MRKILISVGVFIAFITCSIASADQIITGEIKSDNYLYYNHILEMDSGKYKKLTLDNGGFGVFLAEPDFIDSSSHTVKEKKGKLDVTLEKGWNVIDLSFNVKPVINTPVFVSYDLSPYIGEFLDGNNPITIKYPSHLQFIGAAPEGAVVTPTEISLKYPYSDFAGVISFSFIQKTLPSKYVMEKIGMFTIIGTRSEVDLIKKAVQDLGFLPDVFREITGKVVYNDLYIVIGELSGQGMLYTETGGIYRKPNILVIDKGNFLEMTEYMPAFTKLIIHEAAHAETVPLIYGGQSHSSSWVNEGLAVFVANYVADAYLDEPDYFIEEDEDGDLEMYQDVYNRFTPSTLTDAYKRKFMYETPDDEDLVDLFYTHAGLVFYSFYKDVGQAGMNTFMQGLSKLPVIDNCIKCQARQVLKLMTQVSGKTSDQLLYPYKGSKNYFKDLAPIIKNDYTEKQVRDILRNYKP